MNEYSLAKVQKRIEKIELAPLIYDLHIFIADEYELKINCESQPKGEKYPLNNWELLIKNLDIHYSVTCNFTVRSRG